MVGPHRPLVNTRLLSPRPGQDGGEGSIFQGAGPRGPQIGTYQAEAGGGPAMPHYEFHCERCKKEVALTLSIGARERGEYKCPGCGGKQLQPLMGTFFSQTSRKS